MNSDGENTPPDAPEPIVTYELAVDAVSTTAAVLAEHGKPMPPPLEPVDEWSGRVTLRVPKLLHRALAEAAEAESCSLNQHMVNVLSYFTGYAHAEHAADSHWQAQPEPGRVSVRGQNGVLICAITGSWSPAPVSSERRHKRNRHLLKCGSPTLNGRGL
jgi:hypothetical protein